MEKFINLTENNIATEHLCCIIRSKTIHPGVEAKREWLKDRLKEGHVFRKLNDKSIVFIEYDSLEKSWVPIVGNNFYYIYCLWVNGEYKGKGYGRKLMEYCIDDAKRNGKSGICMLGSIRQKTWLSDQRFAEKFGFSVVDSTDSGYELLSLSFDGTNPKFTDGAKSEKISNNNLTIYYDMQCPYIYQEIEMIKKYCHDHKIDISLIKVDTLKSAKELPCVFNNFGVFYNGKFETVNLLDSNYLERIFKKGKNNNE